MKLLFDFFPVLIFFGVYHGFGDLFLATGATMVASVVQIVIQWFWQRKIEPIHYLTLFVVLIFGGLTLFFHDGVFIKLRPTVTNWLFACIITFFLFRQKTALEYIMGGQITLPSPVWKKLNLAWVVFFLIMGALNLYIAFYYNLQADETVREEFWVNFKSIWALVITFAFSILQGLFLMKHLVDPENVTDNETTEKTANNASLSPNMDAETNDSNASNSTATNKTQN